jgi:hypothetical protein
LAQVFTALQVAILIIILPLMPFFVTLAILVRHRQLERRG